MLSFVSLVAELAIDDSFDPESGASHEARDIAVRFSLLVEVLSRKTESGKTGFDTEFENLAEVDKAVLSNDSEFCAAKLPSNVSKNRYNNILASMSFACTSLKGSLRKSTAYKNSTWSVHFVFVRMEWLHF